MLTIKEVPDRSLPQEDQLLIRFSWCCQKFRECSYIGNEKTLPWLIREVDGLMSIFPDTVFVKGLRSLGLSELAEDSRVVFFCFCELFATSPLEPANASSFMSSQSEEAFENGIEALLSQGLVLSVAVNDAGESKASKDNYLLSPETCGKLFRGRDELIRPTVISQFGSLIPWEKINSKFLHFPDRLRDRLGLLSRAVSADQFDQVVQALTENGLRGGVTALFYGPPGTGKTEFARQLALQSHRDLLLVDSAKLDATYFGEKPRNIRDFFRIARYAAAISINGPIIFIDEADGLLCRRVEALKSADKEDNTTTNIFLEEMNSFSGILIASTNHIGNIDPAMLRRFLIRAEFPIPDRDTLARIWQAKVPWLKPEEASTLAERFPISGGLIDNVVSLCFLEKIVDGKEPSLDRILRLCAEQGGRGRPSPIGFKS